MSPHQSIAPPTGRITLVALAVVAAAMGFPWHSARERWVLGIALVVVVSLLARWRGLAVTTIVRRRLAMRRPKRGAHPAVGSGTDVRATVLLRVGPPVSGPDALPLPLIASYTDRYGLSADAIRVTSRDTTSDAGVPQRETWIGLTFSAADNLAALQARSPQIPLHETAEIAARRLADHLRENGWTAGIADPEDIPALYGRRTRETWRGIRRGNADYVAAYQVKADTALPNTLAAIWSYPVRETWTALEISGAGDRQTLAVACAFHTDTPPAAGGPLPGLISHSGNHRPALTALHPPSTQQLDGHVAVPEALLLTRVRWPSAIAQLDRAAEFS
ncbi:type VII secretion protein EccE [Candidatus Mycobacterium methanotrophicum]|uniref:Type VII secretion protein EccE n=1 Tax=Candidatus Mycobacterium methanotrophicum TaxID=2943498 RepID=A0ABY4QKL6_9MYCO|nr:type VII secretion protein EccE [Candidatus Mycobacterium methanotrophicum]UQX10792.1 type VII secretion protein EccE [Candidatus Mycobacterium methanotrophicum]